MTSCAKALFVSPAAEVYGSEQSMLAQLQARQFNAEVVCPCGGKLEGELRDMGIKIYPLEFGKYSLRQNPIWHIRFLFRFLGILKKSCPDVLIINLDGNTPLVTIAAALLRVSIIRFCRFEFKPPDRWLDSWCWRKTSAIICPSDLVLQQVEGWDGGILTARSHRIYESFSGSAADADQVAEFRDQFDLSDGRLVGYVGRLHRGKRIEVAIEAFATVEKLIPDLKMVIVGGDNGSDNELAYREELLEQAGRLGIGHAVVFLGYLPAEMMPSANAAFSVVILPSEAESFGMVLMEAWAQGTPTVASDVGGCSEITRTSGGGVLVPVGDVGAFGCQLSDLLSNSQAARLMGQSGREWVEQNCSPSQYAKDFLTILNNLISSFNEHPR